MTKAVIENFEIFQGDYFKNRLMLKDGTTPVDISSYEFKGNVLKVSDNSTVQAFTIDTSEIGSNYVNFILLESETLSLLYTENYKYAMAWKNGSGKPFTFKVGSLEIKQKGVSWD